MSTTTEAKPVWEWETYQELDDGTLVRYHYSYHDDEDEFGRTNSFDPGRVFGSEAEAGYPGRKVVGTVLKYWVRHSTRRCYDNDYETVVTTVWKEDIRVVKDFIRKFGGFRYLAQERLCKHFAQFPVGQHTNDKGQNILDV